MEFDGEKHIPPLISCLLANTRRKQSFISRSFRIRCNSVRASSIRARSAESTTKIRAWVPVGERMSAYLLGQSGVMSKCGPENKPGGGALPL